MARPKKATVDYFPHSCNHGKTIMILQQTFGLEGYAVWFKLLEQLGRTNNHYIDCRDDTTWLYLSAEVGIDEEKLTSILDLCSRLKAIDQKLWENKIIASENFLENVKDAYKKRSIEYITISFIMEETGLRDTLTELIPPKLSDNVVNNGINPQSKVDETILEKIRIKELEKQKVIEMKKEEALIEKRRADKVKKDSFSKFYEAYNFKKSKGQAEKAWNKIKECDYIKIIDQAKIASSINENSDYRKHPSTWLNGECWDDEDHRTRTTMDEIKRNPHKEPEKSHNLSEQDIIDIIKGDD